MTKKIIHVQVSGDTSPERLYEIGKQFERAKKGGTVVTPDDVMMNPIEIDAKIKGVIVQPRATILDIARTVRNAIEAYHQRNSENEIVPFESLDELYRSEAVAVTNMVLRGAITKAKLHEAWANWLRTLTSEDHMQYQPGMLLPFDKLAVRELAMLGLVIEITKSMFHLLPAPDRNVREVWLLENPDERTWKQYSFLAIRKGNVIRYGHEETADMYHVTSDPYVNYLNNAAWTCDVQPFTWEMLDANADATTTEAGE